MARRLALLFALIVSASPLYAAAQIRDVDAEVFTDEKLGLTVLGCTTALVPGSWEIVGVEPPGALAQAYVRAVPADAPQRSWRGENPNTSSRRARLAQVRQRTTGDGIDYHIRSYADLYGRYADAHGGKGPASVEDLVQAAQAPPAEAQKDEKHEEQAERTREEYQRENDRETLAAISRSPWPEDAGKKLPGPFYFLVPEVSMANRLARERWPRPTSGGEPIVLELRPLLDDGKHWVAFSNGRVERVPVDGALLAKYQLTLSPLLPKEDAVERAHPLRADSCGRRVSGAAWRSPAHHGRLERSRRARRLAGDAPDATAARRSARGAGARVRAARVHRRGRSEVPPLRHDARRQRTGGRLALADSVPADRLFAYFAKPAALFPFIEAGGDFLARAGSLFSSSSMDDNLVKRYLGRLGLEGKLGRGFLESGEVLEAAIIAPDIFLLDGTDLSVLLRVKRPDKVAAG